MTDEQHQGVIGAISDLGSKVVGALPPAVLGLLAINTVFIGLTYWHLDRQTEARVEILTKIVDHCLK